MNRVTSVWTELHSVAAVAVLVTSATILVGLAEPPPYSFVVAGAVAATALVSLALRPIGGMTTGLVGAAAVIAAKQATGGWTTEGFWVALAETVAFLAVGTALGWLGTHLRQARTGTARDTAPAPGAEHGSLGLLAPDVAMARLEDETDRAARYRRPLALVVVQTRIVDAATTPEQVEAAHRSVARLLESRLRATDVLFALTRDRLGAILVETDRAGAWQVAGPLLDAMQEARFVTRSDGRGHDLAALVDLDIGIATLSPRVRSAAGLLDLALTRLDRDEAPS